MRPNMCACAPAPISRCSRGMLWHIFKNGWEDKEFIKQRVYGMDEIRKEVEKWNPEEVERVTGVPGAQLEARRQDVRDGEAGDADLVHGRRPSTRSAPPTCGRAASCCLLTGNVGASGTGANIFRGHDNVQGATDRRPRYRDAAVLLRPRRRRLEALVRASGKSITTGC